MLLPTCQWYFPCRCGKRGIQIMQIFLCQMNGKASEIIFHMGYITGFGYGNDTGLTHRVAGRFPPMYGGAEVVLLRWANMP